MSHMLICAGTWHLYIQQKSHMTGFFSKSTNHWTKWSCEISKIGGFSQQLRYIVETLYVVYCWNSLLVNFVTDMMTMWRCQFKSHSFHFFVHLFIPLFDALSDKCSYVKYEFYLNRKYPPPCCPPLYEIILAIVLIYVTLKPTASQKLCSYSVYLQGIQVPTWADLVWGTPRGGSVS